MHFVSCPFLAVLNESGKPFPLLTDINELRTRPETDFIFWDVFIPAVSGIRAKSEVIVDGYPLLANVSTNDEAYAFYICRGNMKRYLTNYWKQCVSIHGNKTLEQFLEPYQDYVAPSLSAERGKKKMMMAVIIMILMKSNGYTSQAKKPSNGNAES